MLETTVRHAEVFDATLALNSVGGDSEFLTELVGLIRAAWPTLLADIGKRWPWEICVPLRGRRASPKPRHETSRRKGLMIPLLNSRR